MMIMKSIIYIYISYVVKISGLYTIERFTPIPTNTTFLRTVIINHNENAEIFNEGLYLDSDIYDFLVYGNNNRNYTDHDHVFLLLYYRKV